MIKEAAVSNPASDPRDIFSRAVEGLTDEQRLKLKYPAAQRQIELKREIPGAQDVDAQTIDTIIIGVFF